MEMIAQKNLYWKNWEADSTLNAGFVFLLDAPGATPNAGWEGNVRAIKRKSEEGNVHDGRKGKKKNKTKQKRLQILQQL